MEMQATLHPTEPHWYLPWMGVVPEAQGMGIGGALLHEGLARADADRLPVYLEATTRRSAAFYARHGFETTGDDQPSGLSRDRHHVAARPVAPGLRHDQPVRNAYG